MGESFSALIIPWDWARLHSQYARSETITDGFYLRWFVMALGAYCGDYKLLILQILREEAPADEIHFHLVNAPA